jgi:hypothetical protein
VNQSEEAGGITLHVVSIDGEPWWRACQGELCVEDRCGARAQELLRLAGQSGTSQTTARGSSEAASSGGCS